MNEILSRTAWANTVRRGHRPTQAQLRDHLLTVHRLNAGFTEACAQRCRDGEGRNSYEWLADVIDPSVHRTVLDLACGSGPLIALCHERHGDRLEIAGVDMSLDELRIARARVAGTPVRLHHGMAQDLGAVGTSGVDVVLCHWALTLMDPVEPVLREVDRLMAPGGVFAAIVDGDRHSDPTYRAADELVHEWVRREFPHYDAFGLGDPRVRERATLERMARDIFSADEVAIDEGVFTLEADGAALAREAAGFFYASFVLSPAAHGAMLSALTALLSDGGAAQGRFSMPVNRLVVRRGG